MTRWLALLPMPLLLAAGAWGSARTADRAGASAAVALSAVAVLLKTPVEPTAVDEDEAIPTEVTLAPEPVAAPVAKGKKSRAKPARSGPPALFVSRDTVLNLANTGARPRGVPVVATPLRPAGLKLFGVAPLGIGLRDGDVLTRAVGQPALSSGAVIRAVLVARSHHAPVLDGEFWRGNQQWVIRVEQPYPSDRRSEGTQDGDQRLTLREARSRLSSP